MSAVMEKTPSRPHPNSKGTSAPSVQTRLAVLETRWEDLAPTLTTKTDLGELRTWLEHRHGELLTELERRHGELLTELERRHGGLRTELERRHGELRTEHEHRHGELRTELEYRLGELRTELHKMDARIARWMLTTIAALFVGFAGMFFAQQRNLDHAISRLERLYIPNQATTAEPPPATSAQD